MIHSVIVDYGGTKTAFLALDARGKALRAIKIPSQDLTHLPRVIGRVLERWGARKLSLLTVGAKSVWAPRKKQWLYRRTKALAKKVVILSDIELAYDRIFGKSPGILVLAGTGSIALGRNRRGKLARAGGLGPTKGDEGSAYWIGMKALGHAGKKINFGEVQRLAACAPRVIQKAKKGDRACQEILEDAFRHLFKLVKKVRVQLKDSGLKVRFAGGLFQNEHFRRGFLKLLNSEQENRGAVDRR